MPRPILFSKQFESYHGLTPEQFLSGMSVSHMGGEKIVHATPEEHDEFKRSLGPRHVKAPYREHLEATLGTPTDIRSVIAKYRSGPSEVGVGISPLVIARDLRDFTNEMEKSARPNDRTLYRGAQRPPTQDAFNDTPISFSENRAAANAFARANRGEVFKMQAGSVKGLRMEDYGVTPMTVGPRKVSEAEWLIDPQSIR